MNSLQDDLLLGVDIGGSHISAAFVDISACMIRENTFVRQWINSKGTADEILTGWLQAITACLHTEKYTGKIRIAIAMPGPFDYENGISFITGLDKYEELFRINIREYLSEQLHIPASNILFRNDAEAFLAGEIKANNYPTNVNTLGITLGTGLGSALSKNGITRDANFAITPFHHSIAEEHLSTRWFISRFLELTGTSVKDVKEMLSQTQYSKEIELIFKEFTQNLSEFLTIIMNKEAFQTLIIGGNIAKTSDKFLEPLLAHLHQTNHTINVHLANLGEASAMMGAALLFNQTETIIPL